MPVQKRAGNLLIHHVYIYIYIYMHEGKNRHMSFGRDSMVHIIFFTSDWSRKLATPFFNDA